MDRECDPVLTCHLREVRTLMNHPENAILFADGWYILVNGVFVKA